MVVPHNAARFLLGTAVAVALPFHAAPARAAWFDFVLVPHSPPRDSVNLVEAKFTAIGDAFVNLIISDSNSTGIRNQRTVNYNNLHGLCAWTSVGYTGLGRCGYGDDPSGSVSEFTFYFDSDVSLVSFDVSSFSSSELAWGGIRFSRANGSYVEVSFSSPGVKPLSFFAPANEAIYVQTSAGFAAGNPYTTGLIRIGSLTITPVPAPLPILGPFVLFRFSRRLSARCREREAGSSVPRRFQL